MRIFARFLSPLLIFITALAIADVKIPDLPQGSGAGANVNDSFPYNDSILNLTRRLTLGDLINLPWLAAPMFSGTVTAPSFVGPLTGNASTATELASLPSPCGANTYATSIDRFGNLTCSAVPDTALATSYLKADGTRGLTGNWNAGAHTITATTFIGGLTGNVSGNASTATQLAATPTSCGANTYATTIDAFGNLTCSAVPDTALATSYLKADGTRGLTGNWNAGSFNITATSFTGHLIGNADTSTEFASLPTSCGSNTFAASIDRFGNLTCSAVPNAALATMSAHTFKGNNTGSSSTPLDLTATQLTAELNVFVGDSGSGGTKGLVPAPSAGDAAADKFLKADGTWATTPAATLTAPTHQFFTSTGTTAGYLFNISTSSTVAIGDTYTNNSNTYTVLGALSAQSGNVLFMSGASAPTSSGTLARATGSGTSSITFSANTPLAAYTRPTSPTPLYLKIRTAGPGGGGAGSSQAYGNNGGGAGTTGSGPTVFGANLITAGPGSGGQAGNGSQGGPGGTPSFSSPAICSQMTGNQGGASAALSSATGYGQFGNGGAHPIFGGGTGVSVAGTPPTVPANSGAGGTGGPQQRVNDNMSGSGGGSGAGLDCIVPSPTTTYYYAIGTGGAGGGAGTSGIAGAAGADGKIEVWEYYQ